MQICKKIFGKTIFIDEFESFTEDEYEMLQVLFSDATDLYIALRTENASETSLSFLNLFIKLIVVYYVLQMIYTLKQKAFIVNMLFDFAFRIFPFKYKYLSKSKCAI